jgi:5,5'-dehydrodivanillate O-demethylase
MLTQEENARLSCVGPMTPMGNLLRRYWHPIAATSEMERERVLRIRLLGEDLVLYMTTKDEMGLIQERCPHRSASLAYGIPDEDGIRCAYHGWYFNGEGRCLAQPFDDTENPENTFKDKIRIDAYEVQELGGMVWAYMGPQPAPLLPRLDLLVQDGINRTIAITKLPCNWLQCMENSLDPVHFEWLHAHLSNYLAERMGRPPVMTPRPHLQIAFDVFDLGIQKRRLLQGQDPETSDDWTTGHPVLFPYTLAVGNNFQIRVPIDDTNTLHIRYETSIRKPGEPEQTSVPAVDLPYKREDGSFILDSGAFGQDMMAWVSQGALTPRHLEHLGVSDRGIIIYRNVLSDAIDAVERGEDPPGIIRDPALNEPMIDIVREGNHLGSYRIAGRDAALVQREVRQRVAPSIPTPVS